MDNKKIENDSIDEKKYVICTNCFKHQKRLMHKFGKYFHVEYKCSCGNTWKESNDF